MLFSQVLAKIYFQIVGKCFVLLSYAQMGHIKVQGFEFDPFSAALRLKSLPYRQEDTTLKVVWVLCSCTVQLEHPQNPHVPPDLIHQQVLNVNFQAVTCIQKICTFQQLFKSILCAGSIPLVFLSKCYITLSYILSKCFIYFLVE